MDQPRDFWIRRAEKVWSVLRVRQRPVCDECATERHFRILNPVDANEDVQFYSERTCHLYDGIETSMPLRDALGVFTLTALPDGGTRVAVSMHYVVKYGPIGILMDILMIKRMLGPAMDRLLAGLDHHISTGETVGKKWTPSKRDPVAACLWLDPKNLTGRRRSTKP